MCHRVHAMVGIWISINLYNCGNLYIGVGTRGAPEACAPPSFHTLLYTLLTTLCVVSTVPPQLNTLSYAYVVRSCILHPIHLHRQIELFQHTQKYTYRKQTCTSASCINQLASYNHCNMQCLKAGMVILVTWGLYLITLKKMREYMLLVLC